MKTRSYKYLTEHVVEESKQYAGFGVPKGYVVVDFRPPKLGESFQPICPGGIHIAGATSFAIDQPRRILKRVDPVVFEFHRMDVPLPWEFYLTCEGGVLQQARGIDALTKVYPIYTVKEAPKH